MTPSTSAYPQERVGTPILTYTGRAFYPLDPRPEEIFIEDVAHALAHLCRYGGHCLRFLSVAEHSVLLSRAAPPEVALAALLHDAQEAYLVDLPRPVKRLLPDYQVAEEHLACAVASRFGIPYPLPEIVHELDARIVIDERAVNLAPSEMLWTYRGQTEPLGVELELLSPLDAERAFLARFAELTTIRGD